jgi:hypothetical protein
VAFVAQIVKGQAALLAESLPNWISSVGENVHAEDRQRSWTRGEDGVAQLEQGIGAAQQVEVEPFEVFPFAESVYAS